MDGIRGSKVSVLIEIGMFCLDKIRSLPLSAPSHPGYFKHSPSQPAYTPSFESGNPGLQESQMHQSLANSGCHARGAADQPRPD